LVTQVQLPAQAFHVHMPPDERFFQQAVKNLRFLPHNRVAQDAVVDLATRP
jgi:hypothetical protein